MNLEGKVALVSGASRGIGQAIALDLGRNGATVIGTATSDDGAAAISETFRDSSINGRGCRLDITDGGGVVAVVKDISANEGPPLILVNNAGIRLSILI